MLDLCQSPAVPLISIKLHRIAHTHRYQFPKYACEISENLKRMPSSLTEIWFCIILLTNQPNYLPVPTYLQTVPTFYLPTYLPADSTYLPFYLPTCLPTYLPSLIRSLFSLIWKSQEIWSLFVAVIILNMSLLFQVICHVGIFLLLTSVNIGIEDKLFLFPQNVSFLRHVPRYNIVVFSSCAAHKGSVVVAWVEI